MTDWKEEIAEGEAEELEALAARLGAMQRARAQKGRALHLKQHAGIRATLRTFPDLPAFRPLGAMMRARAIAYRESTIQRGATSEFALDDVIAFENPMVLESMEAAMQMQKGQ